MDLTRLDGMESQVGDAPDVPDEGVFDDVAVVVQREAVGDRIGVEEERRGKQESEATDNQPPRRCPLHGVPATEVGRH